MPSTFAWLDHSESDRRKALDIVDLFREQDTRDELGIGTVRDALADSLFPGVSTIQTRAKYLLFIPWIYQVLESNRTKSADMGRLARYHEVALIHALLNSDDTDGVIGKDAKSKLQRLPSSVYWVGLGVFGIRRIERTQEQLNRSLDGSYRLKHQVHAAAEDGIVELSRPQSNWHEGLPAVPDGFPKEATLDLSEAEAEYLRERIMSNVPGTFLAFLVDQGKWWDTANFPWDHPQVGECSAPIQQQLRDAEYFSLMMLGAVLFYNLMLAEKQAAGRIEDINQPRDRVDHYQSALFEWYAQIVAKRSELIGWVESRDDFWDRIHRVNPRVPMPTKRFIDTWVDLVLRTDDIESLIDSRIPRDLIFHREKRLKRKQARLVSARALEMWNGAAGTSRLTYRWRQVQDIVRDILRGLGKERI